MSQKNNFKNSQFTNSQINNIDLSTTNNFYENKVSSSEAATYNIRPMWRNPITMAILTWLSVPSSILAIAPLITMIIQLFRNIFSIEHTASISYMQLSFSVIMFCISMFLLWLRGITKKQIRIPISLLFFQNYALNGYNNQLMLEKITPNPCPICGGQMVYYNKPIEYREIYNNRAIKIVPIKFSPALECKRNTEHYFYVDPAEDSIE